MNHEPQTFCDLQDTGNAQSQLILQAIARHADWDTGEGFPSVKTLARMAKCSEKTARRHIAKLEADGFIEQEARYRKDDGGRSSNLIRLSEYKKWIEANRKGGRVNKPRTAKRYDTPPGQDDQTPLVNVTTPPGQQSDQAPLVNKVTRDRTLTFEQVEKREETVSFDGLSIQLHGDLKALWLAKFDGDAERLELALIAAVPYVQPNSNRPLEAQVSAQLSRNLSDKRDRDKRAAVRSQAQRSSTPRESRLDAARRALEVAGIPQEPSQ